MAHPEGSGGCGVEVEDGIASLGWLLVPTRTEADVPAFVSRLRRRFPALACTRVCRSFMDRPRTTRRSLNSLTASVILMMSAVPASTISVSLLSRSRSRAAARAASQWANASRAVPYNSQPGHTVHSDGSGVAQVEHQFMVTTGGSAGRRLPFSLIRSSIRSEETCLRKAGNPHLLA